MRVDFRIASTNTLWVPSANTPPNGYYVVLDVDAIRNDFSANAQGAMRVTGQAICDATTRAPSMTGCEDLEVNCSIEASPDDLTQYLEPGLWTWHLTANATFATYFEGLLDWFIPTLQDRAFAAEGSLNVACGEPLPIVTATFPFDPTLQGPDPWATTVNCPGYE